MTFDNDASAALRAVARLLSAPTGDIRATLVDEARELTGARAGALVAIDQAERPPRAIAVAAAGASLAGLLDTSVTRLLIVPLHSDEDVLLLGGDEFSASQVELAGAFGAAAAAALGHDRAADEQARHVARQASLTRAAKSPHESLDLETVLTRICREALAILDADLAVVYRGTPEEGLRVAATAGAPPEMIGVRLEPGIGLSGKVLQSGEAMLTNDYQSIAALPAGSPFQRIQASLAIPFEWSEDLRGIISVGYARPHDVSQDDLSLLETFAELAAATRRTSAAHPEHLEAELEFYAQLAT